MIRPEACAALVFGLMAAMLSGCFPDDGDPGELPHASSRPVEGRLAGWSSYEPYGPPKGSEQTALAGAAAKLEAGARRLSPARAAAVLGSLQLIQRNMDGAVASLEEAARLAPGDARVLSDLSAAYLARVRSGRLRKPRFLPHALAAADRAVAIDNQLPAAHFNRALALEALSLWPEARKEWQQYLLLDRESGWHDEATARIAALNGKLGSGPWKEAEVRLELAAAAGDSPVVTAVVRRFPQLARTHFEKEALTRWARAQAAGSSEQASRELNAARTIAAVIASVHGDRLPLDSVATIERTAADPAGGTRLAALAKGYILYREGVDRYEPIDLQGARPSLLAARDALAGNGMPFAHWAGLHLAICDYYDSLYGKSLARLAPLRELAERNSYLALLGRVWWIEGLNHLQSSRPQEALEALRNALTLFERLGEAENVAALHDRLALCLSRLGETEESWSHLEQALQLRREVQTPRRLFSLFSRAQDLALHQETPSVALYFLDEAVAAADAWGSAAAQAESLWSRSQVKRVLGRREEALADLSRAQKHAAEMNEGILKKRIQGDILWVMAQGHLARKPSQAIEYLTQALSAYRETSYPDHLISLHLARGRAYLTMGQEDQAEQDFRAAVELYEERRQRVLNTDYRISYFDQAEEAFDEMVLFQTEHRGRTLQALDYVERARARVLLESMVEASGRRELAQPLTTGALRERLPEGVALIEYRVLKDRLLIWTLRRGDIQFHRADIAAGQLNLLVAQFRSEIERGTEAKSEAARDLGRLLVQPVLRVAPEASVLVFVPDKSLHSVPFAALRSSVSGRFLIQDRLVEVAPSATLYVLARERDQRLASRLPGSVLAIGNPAFDRAAYAHLENLPEAEREAAAVSGLYPESRLLLGAAATRKSFLKAAPGYEVLHLGSHALAKEDAPLGAKLVLAPEPGQPGSGDLSATDIARLRLPRTRIVVLGACHTASGHIWRTEGVESMARPFLAAGVPVVLASLWRADDQATSILLQRFHAEIRRGADPVAALQEAQLSLIGSADEKLRKPKVWSGFELIGGASTYSNEGLP